MKPGTHLTRYIRTRRLELGLTQAQVAEPLGYKPQFVTNWERGTSSPPATAIPKLCKVLRIPKLAMLELLARDSDAYWRGILAKPISTKEAALMSATTG